MQIKLNKMRAIRADIVATKVQETKKQKLINHENCLIIVSLLVQKSRTKSRSCKIKTEIQGEKNKALIKAARAT